MIRQPVGSGGVIHYTEEVVEFCVGVIPALDAEDAALCDRYVRLLAEAISANGPAEAAIRCILAGAQRAYQQGQLSSVSAFLQMASTTITSTVKLQSHESIITLSAIGITGGQAAQKQGQMDICELLYTDVAKLAEGIDSDLEGGALLSLGVLHAMRCDWIKARSCLERACQLLREAGSDENLATSLMELGVAEMEQEDYDVARKHLEEAIVLATPFESNENLTCLPHCFFNLVELGLKDGAVAQSELLEMNDRTLALAQQRKDVDLQSALYFQKERISGDLTPSDRLRIAYATATAAEGSDFWAALNTEIRDAMDMERRAPISEYLSGESSLWDLALGLYINAYTRLAYAEEFEILRHDLSDQVVNQLFQDKNDILQRIVRLFVRKGDIEWAMEFADRSKSQSLMSLCALARIDVVALAEQAGVSPLITRELRDTAMRLSHLVHRQKLIGSTEERMAHTRLRELRSLLPTQFCQAFNLGQAQEDYEALLREKQAWKEYREELERRPDLRIDYLGSDYSAKQEYVQDELAKISPHSKSRQGWLQTQLIPQVASVLASDELLIEYFIDDDGGHIFVLESTGKVNHAPLKLSADRLQALIEYITSDPQDLLLHSMENDEIVLADWSEKLGELYDELIRPVRGLIYPARKWISSDRKQVRKLIIVPHGPLFNLPFAPL